MLNFLHILSKFCSTIELFEHHWAFHINSTILHHHTTTKTSTPTLICHTNRRSICRFWLKSANWDSKKSEWSQIGNYITLLRKYIKSDINKLTSINHGGDKSCLISNRHKAINNFAIIRRKETISQWLRNY